jgi:hypothetical protein
MHRSLLPLLALLALLLAAPAAATAPGRSLLGNCVRGTTEYLTSGEVDVTKTPPDTHECYPGNNKNDNTDGPKTGCYKYFSGMLSPPSPFANQTNACHPSGTPHADLPLTSPGLPFLLFSPRQTATTSQPTSTATGA